MQNFDQFLAGKLVAFAFRGKKRSHGEGVALHFIVLVDGEKSDILSEAFVERLPRENRRTMKEYFNVIDDILKEKGLSDHKLIGIKCGDAEFYSNASFHETINNTCSEHKDIEIRLTKSNSVKIPKTEEYSSPLSIHEREELMIN